MIEHHLPIRKVSPDDGWHYWFGYYDKCPWSPDSTKLLAHRARFCDRFPTPDDVAEVGWIEGWESDTPEFTKIGETTAWNWQQGAMLRWKGLGSVTINLDPATLRDTPAPKQWSTESVSFNTRTVDNTIESAIFEFVPDLCWEDQLPRLGCDTYCVTPQGNAVLTLGWARLSRLRPEYGYAGLEEPDPNRFDPSPSDDGIFRVDADGRHLIVSIDQLDRITVDGSDRAGGQLHQHVNHLMFNPSGTRFCFMHRFVRTDGILHSRLFTSNLQGNDIRLLFEGLVSHYDWRDDETILAWAGKRSLLGSANAQKTPVQHAMTIARRGLKPVYYAMGKPRFLMNKIMKDSYLLIRDRDVRSADATEPEPFAAGELTCDGHCTFSRGDNQGGAEPGRWVLTDGYPDMKSRQPLFLWDCRKNQGYEIGRYHTPREFDGDIRVDLHPRFNQDATLVCIDSAMDGSRGMYVVDVSDLTGGD